MTNHILVPSEKIARVLAVLIANGNYTYVDKLANAPSADLVLFYLREAIRDFHSLIRSENLKNEKARPLLKKVKKELSEELSSEHGIFEGLNRAVTEIYKYCYDSETFKENPKKLREVSSLIGAKALAISSKYLNSEEKSKGSNGNESGEQENSSSESSSLTESIILIISLL